LPPPVVAQVPKLPPKRVASVEVHPLQPPVVASPPKVAAAAPAVRPATPPPQPVSVPPPPLPQVQARVTPPAVKPACERTPFHFKASQSEPVTTPERIAGNSVCVHDYVANDGTLTRASIQDEPSNGTLTQLGKVKFRYVPHPGFRGSDSYTIEVCGEMNGRSGCSALTYEVTIE
jgi:hypothetical protein